MQIGKAITFVFDDPRWMNKVLIGLVIYLIPILNMALLGYVIEIVRRISRGDSEILPEWENIAKRFTDGLLVTIAFLIYFLPLMLCCALALAPLYFAGLFSDSLNQELEDTMTGIGVIGGICAGGIILLYSIAFSLIYPALIIHYARRGRFSACFQIGEFWRMILQDAGSYLTLWLSMMGIGIAAPIVLSILTIVLSFIPCIGLLVTYLLGLFLGVYINLAYAHLIGQFATRNPEPGLELEPV